MGRLIQVSWILTILHIALFYHIHAQSNTFEKLYFMEPYTNGKNPVYSQTLELESFTDGGFCTLGIVTDTTNRSQGVLSRFDCLGKPLWSILLGNSITGNNTNMGITESDSSDIVFAFPLASSFFQATTLIGRVSKSGKILWMKRIGTSFEIGRDISPTLDGGFVIAGSTSAYGSDSQADDIYLVKIDGLGNILWTKTFGNPAGTYDEAFAVKTDAENNIIVTGWCIADGTFQAFILKADNNGNPIKFKTFGANNQRTKALDLYIDDHNNYYITGFTTLLEIDHSSSENDAFLIKVNSDLIPVYTNIYEPILGGDYSTIGEKICQGQDGKIIIGVSTMAFTTHSTGFVPNKNAIYVLNEDGSIFKAFLYNTGGSHYTRIAKTMDGFYISGFTTNFAGNINFQSLVIKVDSNYTGACNVIDVTDELDVYKEIWTIDDYKYQSRSGNKLTNYNTYKDTLIKSRINCESRVDLNAIISGPDSICTGQEFIVFDKSVGPAGSEHLWFINDQPYDIGLKNQKLKFDSSGMYNIKKIVNYSCQSIQTEILVIVGGIQLIRNASGCDRHPYYFYGDKITKTGSYTKKISKTNSCDSTITLIFSNTSNVQKMDTLIRYYCNESVIFKGKNYESAGQFTDFEVMDCDSILYNIQVQNGGCDCIEFPNVFTPSDQNSNNKFRPIIPVSCDAKITEITFQIYNRWGKLIYESDDIGLPGWNGDFKDNPAPAETYTYHVWYKLQIKGDFSQRAFQHKGMFTLLR